MSRYIDADALKPDYIVGSTSTNTECYRYVSLKQIMNAPTADVRKNVHSFWEDGYRSCWDGTRKYFRQCHNCGHERDDDCEDLDSQYCPNCGAMMKGEKDA